MGLRPLSSIALVYQYDTDIYCQVRIIPDLKRLLTGRDDKVKPEVTNLAQNLVSLAQRLESPKSPTGNLGLEIVIPVLEYSDKQHQQPTTVKVNCAILP